MRDFKIINICCVVIAMCFMVIAYSQWESQKAQWQLVEAQRKMTIAQAINGSIHLKQEYDRMFLEGYNNKFIFNELYYEDRFPISSIDKSQKLLPPPPPDDQMKGTPTPGRGAS